MKPDSTDTGACVWPAGRREQSRTEEIANSISHAMALLVVILGTPVLVMHATNKGDAGYFAGASLFCASAIVLYLSSTVYHALPSGITKNVFRRADHCAIWFLALGGVMLKLSGKGSRPWISTGLYLLMGWMIVVAGEQLIAQVLLEGVLWLLAGGIFYTAGVIFYATDSKLKYGHAIWHLFVVSGTACHYFAILWYAA